MVNELPPAKDGKLWLVGSHHMWEIQKVWTEEIHVNLTILSYPFVQVYIYNRTGYLYLIMMSALTGKLW